LHATNYSCQKETKGQDSTKEFDVKSPPENADNGDNQHWCKRNQGSVGWLQYSSHDLPNYIGLTISGANPSCQISLSKEELLGSPGCVNYA
jgi:hypothetical protein